jgi:MoxR-like ATPase
LSTEAPPRPKKGAAAVTVEPADFERVRRYLTTQILVERDLEMRIITLGLLAGTNIHQLGPPGVAKSLGLREFARCIAGGRYFEKLLHSNLPADAVMGGYDMPLFAKTGEFTRNIEHHAPNSHVVFLDELFRANGPLLDAILPLANSEERRAEHNGGMIECPTLVFVSASNHMPDPDNEQAQALVDRITLMQYVEDVRADDSFKEIFRRHHDRRVREHTHTVERETITLEQCQLAQEQVMNVRLTPEFLDAAAELRRDCKNEALLVSPRRWMELGRVCRANAWLAGRDHLIPEDLAVVEHGLWRDIDDRPTAHKVVLKYHGRFEREATQKRQESQKALAAVEQIRPQVEGTPPNEELDPDVLTKAISASRQIDAVKGRVEKLLEEADREKQNAATLRDLDNELVAIQMWFKKNGLPTGYAGTV